MKKTGFSLEWSAWDVWFHPKRSLDIMEDYYLANERTEQTADAASSQIESLKGENERLEVENAKLACAVSDLSELLEQSRTELTDTRKELSEISAKVREQEEIDRTLLEYDRKLDGIIDMKRNYERRIADLEARIRDLSGESSLATVPGFDPKPNSIDMTSEIDSEPPHPSATDNDWLLDLPSL